jgi:hypothetical protein
VSPLSINSANPQGNVTTLQGDTQEFNVGTNYICNITWYLNGELKVSESSVNRGSFYNGTLSPGFYNVAAIAEARDEKDMHSWNWAVREWNPWESSNSKEGKNVSTAEMQEAIHFCQNRLQIPKTGSEVTSETLKELINTWKESPGK